MNLLLSVAEQTEGLLANEGEEMAVWISSILKYVSMVIPTLRLKEKAGVGYWWLPCPGIRESVHKLKAQSFG